MKLFVLLLSMLLLVGCGKTPADPKNLNADRNGNASVSVILSEQEIQRLFLDYAEPGWVLVDCVSVTESDYGIVGVVQYTEETYGGCRFAFLTMNGSKTVGVGARSAGEDRLIYLGGDSISCELLNKSGEYYTCIVSYYEKNEEIGFEISGQE